MDHRRRLNGLGKKRSTGHSRTPPTGRTHTGAGTCYEGKRPSKRPANPGPRKKPEPPDTRLYPGGDALGGLPFRRPEKPLHVRGTRRGAWIKSLVAQSPPTCRKRHQKADRLPLRPSAGNRRPQPKPSRPSSTPTATGKPRRPPRHLKRPSPSTAGPTRPAGWTEFRSPKPGVRRSKKRCSDNLWLGYPSRGNVGNSPKLAHLNQPGAVRLEHPTPAATGPPGQPTKPLRHHHRLPNKHTPSTATYIGGERDGRRKNEAVGPKGTQRDPTAAVIHLISQTHSSAGVRGRPAARRGVVGRRWNRHLFYTGKRKNTIRVPYKEKRPVFHGFHPPRA